MTTPTNTRSKTLVPPSHGDPDHLGPPGKTDDTQTPPHEPAAQPRQKRPLWPRVVLIAAALTMLGLWTLNQQRIPEEVADPAHVPSAQGSPNNMELREHMELRDRAAQSTPVDPSTRDSPNNMELREHMELRDRAAQSTPVDPSTRDSPATIELREHTELRERAAEAGEVP